MPPVITDNLPFITNGGAIGVLAWVFWSLLSGNLIPRKTHEKALEESNSRAQTWKEVAETYKNSLEKKDEVVPAQLASANTVEKLAEALRTLTDTEEKPK